MTDRLDIVLFGASGFTGKHSLPHLYKLIKSGGHNLTWGVAGRSKEKLKQVLREAGGEIGVDLTAIPIIIADVADEESIKKMTAAAKVIMNCTGPYDIYGEVVVRSCIETVTHHLDLTGELQFMERMQEKYAKAAEEKGVYIVHCCGFDSIPADLGVVFMENNFKGCLNSVELYVSLYEEGGWTPGPISNFGTWHSIVNGVGHSLKLYNAKKRVENQLPSLKPRIPWRFPLRRVNIDGKGDKWAVPFDTTDYYVINRSQHYFYENDRKRPVQVHYYGALNSIWIALFGMISLVFIFILSQFSYGKSLLLRYPQYFSWGMFTTAGPPEEKIRRMNFAFTYYGEGWSEKLAEGEDQYKTPPNKAIVGQLRAVDPGYGFTCLAMILCGILILTERKRIPPKGGIYTPAAAFSKTSLVEQLQKNGVKIEILSVKDI